MTWCPYPYYPALKLLETDVDIIYPHWYPNCSQHRTYVKFYDKGMRGLSFTKHGATWAENTGYKAGMARRKLNILILGQANVPTP